MADAIPADHLSVWAKARSGWAEAFQRMAESGDDKLLDETVATDWDEQEWEWK